MPEVRKTPQFDRWLTGLRDIHARARILKRIVRLENGNPGVVEPVGDHVSEIKIDAGPGYRLYFVGPVKGRIVVLLCGGDKNSQQRDIANAKLIAKSIEGVENDRSAEDRDQPLRRCRLSGIA